MQVNNNINFQGIKLSTNKFEKVRDMAFHLQKTGFINIGHRSVICNNTLATKIEKAKAIRSSTNFADREFGTVFYPWSGEAYFFAKPSYEQIILRVINQYDEGAFINLAI